MKADIKALDYTTKENSSGTVINIIARDNEGNRFRIQNDEHESHFFIPREQYEASLSRNEMVTNIEHGFYSIRGMEMTKVCTRIPGDVPRLREDYEHYEADILYPNRFSLDTGLYGGIQVPDEYSEHDTAEIPLSEIEKIEHSTETRVMFCDIEVDDEGGFPDETEGKEEVVCLSFYDTFEQQYHVYLYRDDEPEVNPEPELVDDVNVEVFDNEVDMLSKFADELNSLLPDVLAGWNFKKFDAMYLISRFDELDELDKSDLSPLSSAYNDGWYGGKIRGFEVFDMLKAYKNLQFTELDSYSLEDVAQEELGIGKLEEGEERIHKLWDNDLNALLEYNIRDVYLTVQLEQEQGIIKFYEEVADFVGGRLSEVVDYSKAADIYVLRQVNDKFVVPSADTIAEDSEEFEGAEVFDPATEIKDMVSVLDLACFTSDTEVITPDGIYNITDVEKGDSVYTLNRDTHEVEITKVTETYKYKNKYGRIGHINGNTSDFKITENHNLYTTVLNNTTHDELSPSDFELTELRNIADKSYRYAYPSHEPLNIENTNSQFNLLEYIEDKDSILVSVYPTNMDDKLFNKLDTITDNEIERVRGSSRFHKTDERIDKILISVSDYLNNKEIIDENSKDVFIKGDKGSKEINIKYDKSDWAELIGWYISEGSIQTNSRGIKISQSQSNTEYRNDIENLLDELDIDYHESESGFNISNIVIQQFLKRECGKGSYNKQIPDWLLNSSLSVRKRLLKSLIKGDGSIDKHGLRKYWTSSEELKEDVVQLAVRCGFKPTVKYRNRGDSDEYYISMSKGGSFRPQNGEIEEHENNVYCITTEENNVILAGRNGKFQWIGQSLYPMSMKTINAGPRTKDPDGEITAPNGVSFTKGQESIISELIDNLLEEREDKKEQRNKFDPDTDEYVKYDLQQTAVKVIMNTLYGVLGWDRFRLYDEDVAASVTATGREVIKHTQEIVEQFGYAVIYGDTDSVMVEMSELNNIKSVVYKGFQLEEVINESYDEFAKEELNVDEHFFEIEFEKVYRRFIQAGKKKRYAGHIIWKEGKETDSTDIVGFEYQRSDYSPVAKELQKKLINMILDGADREQVSRVVRDEIEKITNLEHPLDDLGIPGGIGQAFHKYENKTKHVRAAEYANEYFDEQIQPGDKPKGIYVNKIVWDNPQPPAMSDSRFICWMNSINVPDGTQYDWNKYLDVQINGPLSRIIECTEWTWSEIISGEVQTGYADFQDEEGDDLFDTGIDINTDRSISKDEITEDVNNESSNGDTDDGVEVESLDITDVDGDGEEDVFETSMDVGKSTVTNGGQSSIDETIELEDGHTEDDTEDKQEHNPDEELSFVSYEEANDEGLNKEDDNDEADIADFA